MMFELSWNELGIIYYHVLLLLPLLLHIIIILSDTLSLWMKWENKNVKWCVWWTE